MSSSKLGMGWGLGLAVAAACTRPNLAYDQDDATQTEGAASVGDTGDGTVTTGPPGDGTIGDGTIGDGTIGDSEGPAVCIDDGDCADGMFCNGPEICDASKPEADGFGCLPGLGDPCAKGASCDEVADACMTDCQMSHDADGDGFDAAECGGTDCNDSNFDANPDADEVCDELDVDEDCDPASFGTLDMDGDGLHSNECCNENDGGGVVCGTDCDDGLPGFGLGDWAHCGGCNQPCGVLQACDVEMGMCMAARRVFVTSTTQSGNLGGLEGADMLCQERVEPVGLEGTWRALLVTADSALDARLEHSTVPYVRLDGTRIANDWTDLTDGSLAAPLNVTEQRWEVDGFGPETLAWTGLSEEVILPNGFCEGWTYGDIGCGLEACGTAGSVVDTNSIWDSTELSLDCGLFVRLYCIEQDPVGG